MEDPNPTPTFFPCYVPGSVISFFLFVNVLYLALFVSEGLTLCLCHIKWKNIQKPPVGKGHDVLGGKDTKQKSTRLYRYMYVRRTLPEGAESLCVSCALSAARPGPALQLLYIDPQNYWGIHEVCKSCRLRSLWCRRSCDLSTASACIGEEQAAEVWSMCVVVGRTCLNMTPSTSIDSTYYNPAAHSYILSNYWEQHSCATCQL